MPIEVQERLGAIGNANAFPNCYLATSLIFQVALKRFELATLSC